jgi:TonB family protein
VRRLAALTVLVAALSLAPGVSAVPGPPDLPPRATFDELVRAMRQATDVSVVHFGLTGPPAADSVQMPYEVLYYESASAGWSKRFVSTLMVASRYEAAGTCLPSCWPCDSLEQVVAQVRFEHAGERTLAILMFRERCVQLVHHGRPAGRVPMGPAAGELFKQIRDALRADPTLRAQKLPEPVPAGEPARAGAAGRPPVLEQVPEVIDGPPPVYPEGAREKGLEGTVLVRAMVDQLGRVVEAFPAEPGGSPELDQAAVEAVRQWRFRPAMSAGQPVVVWVVVPVEFSLR